MNDTETIFDKMIRDLGIDPKSESTVDKAYQSVIEAAMILVRVRLTKRTLALVRKNIKEGLIGMNSVEVETKWIAMVNDFCKELLLPEDSESNKQA